MSVEEPFVWVEVQVDGCGLTFGQGDCPAALGVNGVERKCWNTFGTCRAKQAYDHITNFRTIRMCQPRQSVPKGELFFPILSGPPSEFSATVNVAGSDDDLSAFGRTATVSVGIDDMAYHDRALDPYAAERESGAAQADGIGYSIEARGTMWSRLKTRWPHYAGRPLRVCVGHIDGASLVTTSVRHYVITNISGPDNNGRLNIEAKDVLDLADDKKAVAPQPSNGRIQDAMAADGLPTITLTPEGIGDSEYPASGRACIGSEIVSYTRVGDTVTITGRGLSRTDVADHQANSTFQVVLSYQGARLDVVIRDLLVSAGVDPAFIPMVKWAAEVDRWLSGTRITTDITKATGVKKLISTLVPLGTSVYWESADQEIVLKANRPVDGDQVWTLTDRNSHLSAIVEENDEKRLTEVIFYTVQANPTSGSESADGYDRAMVATDLEARAPWAYGVGRVKTVFCPWLNDGADAIVRVAARRLLMRFATTPKFVRLRLDNREGEVIRLTDVLRVTTFGLQDETGLPVESLYQVIRRSEPRPGEQVEILAQSYQFTGRFAYATENDTPSYLLATPAERDPGMFAADPITLRMSNGDQPYRAI